MNTLSLLNLFLSRKQLLLFYRTYSELQTARQQNIFLTLNHIKKNKKKQALTILQHDRDKLYAQSDVHRDVGVHGHLITWGHTGEQYPPKTNLIARMNEIQDGLNV